MSSHMAEDIVQYLVDTGGYGRLMDIFTPADIGQDQDRPLAIVVRDIGSEKEPEITEDVDYVTFRVTVSGSYGETGEKIVADTSMDVYSRLRVLNDVTVNGTLYLSVRALSPPSHVGYDEFGRTVYEVSFEAVRYLGKTEEE